MDDARRAELSRAYHSTTYGAMMPVRLRIGQPDPMLDALLTKLDVATYAYLTAWNPGSRERPEAENRAAQDELIARLRHDGYTVFEGAAVADDASWPAEPSLLVPGLPRANAIALGRAYGQAAILVGLRGRAPELVWIE